MGGLRWWGLGKHLARKGWAVRILTAETRRSDDGHPDGLRVERVAPRRTLERRYRHWRVARSTRANGGRQGPTNVGHNGVGPRGFLRLVRRELGGVLGFPDEGRGWVLRAARSVRKAAGEFAPDFVVSSGPPHSVHMATWAGLRESGASWIADLRDPWAESARHHLDVAWWAPVMRGLEGRVVPSVERVLTTTPQLALRLRRRFPGLPVTHFPNGADTEVLPPRRAPGGVFSVVHLGTLYLHRDPTPVIRAFSSLLEVGGEEAFQAHLRFIGPAEGDLARRINDEAEGRGLGDSVFVEPSRPRKEALEVLAGSGASVVLAQNQRTQVPAKIYESVAMGVPTVVVTEPDSASGEAGRRLGAAVHPPEDLEGIASALRAARTGEWTGTLPAGVKVDYAELADELEELLRGGERSGVF